VRSNQSIPLYPSGVTEWCNDGNVADAADRGGHPEPGGGAVRRHPGHHPPQHRQPRHDGTSSHL